MIANNAEAVGGSQVREIGRRLVGVQMTWPSEGCFERRLFAQPRQSTVFRQRLALQEDEGPRIDPLQTLHFARGLERIAIFRHKLAALGHLPLDLGVVGSEEIAGGSFYGE